MQFDCVGAVGVERNSILYLAHTSARACFFPRLPLSCTPKNLVLGTGKLDPRRHVTAVSQPSVLVKTLSYNKMCAQTCVLVVWSTHLRVHRSPPTELLMCSNSCSLPCYAGQGLPLTNLVHPPPFCAAEAVIVECLGAMLRLSGRVVSFSFPLSLLFETI